jgi:hypothetical protein
MARATTVGVFCVLTSGALYGGACAKAAPLDPALADVVFEGEATGPALDSLLAATPVMSAARAAVIDAPPTGTILKASSIATFTWHAAGATTARLPPSLLPRPARPEPAPWLRDLVGPERAARASESGVGYLLQFSTETTPRLLRVFTSDTRYTPDAKAWKTLSAAMIWTQLSIFTATFEDDALVAGEGPFEGTPILFCIDR